MSNAQPYAPFSATCPWTHCACWSFDYLGAAVSDHLVCRNCRPRRRDIIAAVLSMQVAVEKIGAVIGPGGRVIQGARDTSGAESINVSSAHVFDSSYWHFCSNRKSQSCGSLCTAGFSFAEQHQAGTTGVSHLLMQSSMLPLGVVQIEQDGWVTVVAYSDQALEAGLQAIRDVVAEIETGTIYRCTAPAPELDVSRGLLCVSLSLPTDTMKATPAG